MFICELILFGILLVGIIYKLFPSCKEQFAVQYDPGPNWYTKSYPTPVDNIFIELLPNYTYFYDEDYNKDKMKTKNVTK